MLSADLNVILPELALVVYAMAALLYAVYTGKDREAPMLLWITAGLMAVLAGWIGLSEPAAPAAFGGSYAADGFARFAKVAVLLAGALVLLLSQDYLTRQKLLKFEYPVLIALATVGMMVMVSASDLMVLYMGLELQSLALYVVAAFKRDGLRSTEAGLKYFVLGALSSGLLLYGASLIYGFAGTTSFAGITAAIGSGPVSMGLLFGLVFLLTGLAFKISAVPFHMWTPDVYEGSPTPVTTFFATTPKVAAIALIARVGFDAFGGVVDQWQQILALLSVLSMVLGAIAAIGQTDIKRLMAYSSIAHMGYALMGLAAGTALGVKAMLVYVAIYVTMNLGTFAFILSMERDGRPVSEISALGMYSRREPGKALALLLLFFSLAGVPPLLGFFGKFYVLAAAWQAGLTAVVIIGVLASVVGAYYYLRIVFLMYFGEETDGLDGQMPAVQWAVLWAAAIIMLVGIVNFLGVDAMAGAAADALLR